MLDFVPNHTALDHPWVQSHPEFYVQGTEDDLARQPNNYCKVQTAGKTLVVAHGRDPYFPGWPDTLQLNYRHSGLREAMKVELARIAGQCDAVRCDMAMLVLPDVIARTWGNMCCPSGRQPAAVDPPFWPEATCDVRREHARFIFMAEVYWDPEWNSSNKDSTTRTISGCTTGSMVKTPQRSEAIYMRTPSSKTVGALPGKPRRASRGGGISNIRAFCRGDGGVLAAWTAFFPRRAVRGPQGTAPRSPRSSTE